MISLYIHIPFCKSKCLFCSFVIAVAQEGRIDSYIDSLASEAKAYSGTNVSTVYLGGGTPSQLHADQLRSLLDMVRNHFSFSTGCEFTVEANPESVDIEKAKMLREYGVNRVSLGVQSLNDKYLKFLGRNHDRARALKAFGILREAGFLNINLDLMFSFPGQALSEIEEDVGVIASLQSEHLSLYTLTVEEGSRFYRQNVRLDDGLCRAEHYTRVAELLAGFGFHQYEISNFAKTGKESAHNLTYWRGGNYIGLGVGAHSHIDGRRFWNTSNLNVYLSQTKQCLSAAVGEERLTAQERFMEDLLFGLRTSRGTDIEELRKKYDCMLPAEKKETIGRFIDGGFLKQEGTVLKAEPKGRLVLDELCARLI